MKKLLHILCLLLLISACKKEEFEIHNLNNDEIFVLGHAGMGFSNLYPSNSLVSILACLNVGADGSEMDIQMTRDSVLVLFHDEMLDESTNGSGQINSMSWQELKAVGYTNVPYGNYPLVRLDDFLSEMDAYPGRRFTFDIKLYAADGNVNDYFEAFSDKLVQIFEKYDLYSTAYIESQSTDFLNLLKGKKPDLQLYFYPQSFEEGFQVALDNGYKGISITTDIISAEQVKQAHDNGLFVTLWGASSKDKNIEAIRKNPDMIQTDKVEHLVDLLN